MSLQAYFDKQSQMQRDAVFASSDQISLGDLISLIQPIVLSQDARRYSGQGEAVVVFDFPGMYPCGIGSWRGIYRELSLWYSSDGERDQMSVSAFLSLLQSAVNKTFTGYKGGEFIMDLATPIWVDNYGHYNNTAVVGVKDEGHKVIILTKYLRS